MLILAVNAGSSSLKLAIYQMRTQELLIEGQVNGIATSQSDIFIQNKFDSMHQEIQCDNHQEALEHLLIKFVSVEANIDFMQIKAIGHRMIHGGERYHKSVVIDKHVLADIQSFQTLAPLHTPAILCCYDLLHDRFPKAIHCAIFDTSFHQSIPLDLCLYAVPYVWYDKYHVRKYGAHGINHRFLSQRCGEVCPQAHRIITCHLGNGSSIAAIQDGICVNTSIGFSTLSGLMMGTRCGNIDPLILPYMQEQTSMSLENLIDVLYQQSGLLGISNRSNHMKLLLEEEAKGNAMAALAISMYVKQIVQFIGSYVMLLKGVDAIIFSGGIGEHASSLRKRICEYIAPVLDSVLDDTENVQGSGDVFKISRSDSSCLLYVMKAQEEHMIALDTYELCKNSI